MQNVQYKHFIKCNLCNISTFNPLGKSTHGNSLKKPILWKTCGLGNPAPTKSCRSQIWLISARSRIRRDDWQDHAWVFAAQQILSSLTNIWSCKMCSLYTECVWSRIESESKQLKRLFKIFKYTAYRQRLPDALKLYTILECLKEWTRNRGSETLVREQAGNGQKFSGSRIKKTAESRTF